MNPDALAVYYIPRRIRTSCRRIEDAFTFRFQSITRLGGRIIILVLLVTWHAKLHPEAIKKISAQIYERRSNDGFDHDLSTTLHSHTVAIVYL